MLNGTLCTLWYSNNSPLREGKDSFHYDDVQHGGGLSSASREATLDVEHDGRDQCEQQRGHH